MALCPTQPHFGTGFQPLSSPTTAMTQPSRVVHLRALPDATQEADISSFCSAWGAVDTVVLMHSSHQALVQMAQLGCAAAMVTQCAGSAATLRLASGEMAPVQVQFSRHAELNRQGSGGGGGAGGDGAVPNRILLITMRNHTQQYILPAVERAGAQRGDVFVVSKIPCGGYDGGEEPMTTALAESYVAQVLAELGTDYVDLLLLHHVCTTRQETLLAWRVLEAALGRGQARAVGVSNFDTPDLRWLLGVAKEPVAANECHFAAGMMDDEMIRFAAAASSGRRR